MPPRWIESEIKLLLPDEAAYARVRTALAPGRAVLQRNHFFDRADGALRAARIGVRLRAEGDDRLLTLKGGELAGSSDALVRRIELETDLPQDAFEAALHAGLDLRPWLARFRDGAGDEPLAAALERFLAGLESLCNETRLVRYGSFDNLRTIERLALHDEQGLIEIELALDRTELPGPRIDHEIEVELPGHPGEPEELAERTARALERWLADRGIGPVVPAPSKLARFHAALERRSRPAGSGSAAAGDAA